MERTLRRLSQRKADIKEAKTYFEQQMGEISAGRQIKII